MTSAADAKKRVLVLGGGAVTPPLVAYLADLPDVEITVGAIEFSPAIEELGQRPQVSLRELDVVKDEDGVRQLIRNHDVVVSLLPSTLHGTPARLCIALQRPMVTSSYANETMQALDAPAKEAGIPLLKECGFDPGLDHMAAMRVIDRVHERGQRVLSFESHGAGLPNAGFDDNPWRYKFSWSPPGVLLSATRSAVYLENGKRIDVSAEEIFSDPHTIDVKGLGPLEGYPNGNSLKYVDLYGLSDVKSICRGTLRYPGHCATWYALVKSGWLDRTPRAFDGATFGEVTREILAGDPQATPRQAAMALFGWNENSDPLTRFEWLGLFGDEAIPDHANSRFDALLSLMEPKLQYGPGEEDIVLLRVALDVAEDGKREPSVRHVVTLRMTGRVDQQSAMSKCVGLPAAVATRLILEGRFDRVGVCIPTTPDLYEPILDEVERLGISISEQELTPTG